LLFLLPSGVPAERVGAPATPVSYSSSVLADSPSLFYRFNEASGAVAHDSTGTANNLSGSAQWSRAGALANDGDLAAVGLGLSSANAAGLPTGNTSRTVEGWYYRPGAAAQLASWGAGGNGAFTVSVESNTTLAVVNGSVARTFTASHAILDGAWHYFAVTFDGALVTGYLDGESIGSSPLGPLATTATPLAVGGSNGPGLDEVAIYPSALSAAQIAAHFDASGDSRPSAVGDITLATPAANQITVSWVAATAGVPAGGESVTTYRVTALSSGSPGRAIASSGAVTSVTFSGMPAGVAYSFRVQALNQFGAGPLQSSPASVAATGTLSTYSSIVLGNHPGLYYRFSDPDGMVSADSSGTGNDLTGYGYRGTANTVGTPLEGDPDPAMIGLGLTSWSSAGLPLGNAARTVAGWYYRPGSAVVLTGWGDFFVTVDSNKLSVWSNSVARNFTSPRPLLDSTWHQFAVTYDGSDLVAYVDGNQLGTVTLSQALATNATPLSVGGSNGPGLDELAIYPSALTPVQVASLFHAGKGRSEGALS